MPNVISSQIQAHILKRDLIFVCQIVQDFKNATMFQVGQNARKQVLSNMAGMRFGEAS